MHNSSISLRNRHKVRCTDKTKAGLKYRHLQSHTRSLRNISRKTPYVECYLLSRLAVLQKHQFQDGCKINWKPLLFRVFESPSIQLTGVLPRMFDTDDRTVAQVFLPVLFLR